MNTSLYCPKCGHVGNTLNVFYKFSPRDSITVQCKECKTNWNIGLTFTEYLINEECK
jgi:uncharacterized Zn finger protein